MIKIQYFLRKFWESFLAIIKIIILSKTKVYIKSIHPEKECVILMNGPSLNSLIDKYSNFLKEKDLFCANFFPLSDLYTKVKPQYFIISAPELWIADVDEVYIEKRERLIKALQSKTSWPVKIIIPFAAKKGGIWDKGISGNDNLQILYYNDTGVEGFTGIIFWFYRLRLAIPRPHNVLVPSLMNAINLGYKNIFLWGAENNQFRDLRVDENNNALLSQRHFYDRGELKPNTMSKLGTGQRKVHEILHKFVLSFEAYHVINDFATTRGATIINQTPGSLIDAFEREEL